MTTQQHPAQFDWATELLDAQGRVTLSEQEAHEIGARLRSLGAKLKAYEDLGVAPLSANAGEHTSRLAKYVARRKIAKGLAIELIHGFDTNCESEAVLLLSDIEALLAAPPTAQAEGWRPIESAPKDGTEILAEDKHGEHAVVTWYEMIFNRGGGRTEDCSYWKMTQSGDFATSDNFDDVVRWAAIPPTSAEGVEHG